MNIVNEFLETSTIHGLSYISSSHSKISKCLWSLVVIAGFAGAGYLIQSSFSDWRESPIASSVSTHSIADLEFPTVTVCPPEGSNTALNYDLLRLRNRTLTKEEKLTVVFESLVFV